MILILKCENNFILSFHFDCNYLSLLESLYVPKALFCSYRCINIIVYFILPLSNNSSKSWTSFLVIYYFYRIMSIHCFYHSIDKVFSCPAIKPCCTNYVILVKILSYSSFSSSFCFTIYSNWSKRHILCIWHCTSSIKNKISRNMNHLCMNLICKVFNISWSIFI